MKYNRIYFTTHLPWWAVPGQAPSTNVFKYKERNDLFSRSDLRALKATLQAAGAMLNYIFASSSAFFC